LTQLWAKQGCLFLLEEKESTKSSLIGKYRPCHLRVPETKQWNGGRLMNPQYRNGLQFTAFLRRSTFCLAALGCVGSQR